MYKTKKNQVFKYFIIFCIIMSAFVMYFLADRPAKLVLEVVDENASQLEFTFEQKAPNPSFQSIIDRQHDGHHVILVLLTKKLRLMKNTNYEQLLESYEKCNKQFPCVTYKISKQDFLEMAKARKDVKQGP